MLVLGRAEASGILGAELRPPAKACEEYSAMGQTRFAPITLKTNATLMRLKSAKKSSAYGKKQRRTMNSRRRPKYKKGFDGRLSAWPCQIFSSCSGRPEARRRRSHPRARKLAKAPKRSRPPYTRYVLVPELLHCPMVMPTRRKR